MKVTLNLTHPTEAWGTAIFDDGGKAHWIDGRSSVIVYERNGVYTPIYGDGDPRHRMNLISLKVQRSMMSSPMREMSQEEVMSHDRAMAHYYGNGEPKVKTIYPIIPILFQNGERVNQWKS
jgi:hypothetical protein